MVIFQHGRSVGESDHYRFQISEGQKWFYGSLGFVFLRAGSFGLGFSCLRRLSYVQNLRLRSLDCLFRYGC